MNHQHHDTKEIGIRLPANLAGDLERAAGEGGLTASEVVQAALTQYLQPSRRIDRGEVNTVY
ncbi:MAG TPA: hypothetical protein PLG18_06255, partial [Syntrophales bacterium]|nr:hypothetical protein [Syntrophales bacterium]